MKSGAAISVGFLCMCAFFNPASFNPALAQTAVGGGAKKPVIVGGPGTVKPNAIGGPAPTNTAVVVKPKVGTISAPPTPPVTTAVVPPPPASTAGAPPPATNGAPAASAKGTAPTSIVKCAVKGACVGPTKQPTTPSPPPAKGT